MLCKKKIIIIMCLNYTSIPLSRARECWWGLKWAVQKKKICLQRGSGEKILGGVGGGGKVAKKLPSSFYSDGIYNNAKNLPECRKRAFLMSRKCRFPAEACPRTPFFYYVTNSNSTPQKWRNFSYHHNYFNDCSSFICTAPEMIPNPELGIIWGAVQNAYCLLFPIVYSMMFV